MQQRTEYSRPPEVSGHSELAQPTLTVVIPAYNEADAILNTLKHVVEEPTDKEVIIVNDGSVDRTGRYVSHWLETSPAPAHISRRVLLTHPANRGKGAAVRTGLQAARGQYLIIQDADSELDPAVYSALLEPLRSGCAEFVIGHRIPVRRTWTTRVHRGGVILINLCVRILYGERVRDQACGYKVARVEDFRRMNLEANGFACCSEIVAKACRLQFRFQEVQVPYCPRTTHEGKKLRLRDGIEAIRTLFRYRRWNPGPRTHGVDRHDWTTMHEM